MAYILIIDDEEIIRVSLSDRIERLGHKVCGAATLEEGLTLLKEIPVDLVFLDVNLPDGSGLDALANIRQAPSNPEVIIITAVGSAEGAALAIKNGAWDYVTKPFSREEITLHTQRTIDYRKAKQKQSKPVVLDTGNIIGKSAEIKKCINQIASCANSDTNVLIHGETGTGKELFAKAIHDNNSTINGDYIVVDCAAMTDSLTESVLFGHVKGAYTGADRAAEGLVKAADKGTLFLDEIGELPLSMQKVFLRVLQERKFRPVGGSREVTSQFRLISATNRDLDKMVAQGKFGQDLLHRLRTVTITLPPLRERKDDIPILAQHYMGSLCKKFSLKTKALLPETLEVLKDYVWPGNVRELINCLEKAILSEPDLSILFPMFLPDRLRISFAGKRLKDSEVQDKDKNVDPDLSSIVSSLYIDNPPPLLKPFRENAIEKIESLYFKSLLIQTKGNLDETARLSGVSKSCVYHLIKKYKLKASY